MDEFKVPSTTIKVISNTKSPKENPVTNQSIEVNKTTSEIQKSKQTSPYIEPKWSDQPNPENEYKFEVLKSGAIVEEITNLQTKSYWIFGRLPENDISMAHPTISRYHAVLQHRSKQIPELDDEQDHINIDSAHNTEKNFDEGWYIYDLESTHGTFLNKQRIPPKTYIRVRVGHMLRLGGSTRTYILQGPEFDEEPESELSVTQLKEIRHKNEENKREQNEMQEQMREKEGISWGMSEDADEDTDLTVNPYASTNNEEIFLDDPKKTLRGFFEREGLELDYKVDEMSAGTFVCRVELPIDDANGKPIVAEICHKGKKKECVLQCALESCRILDRHGVLRQAIHEPRKRAAPLQDSDDDDDFLDRTGDVERKKLKRAAAASHNTALTYEDLKKQESDYLEKISAVEESILRYRTIMKRSKETSNQTEEDLDDYMKNLSQDDKVDKTEIRKLRVEQQRLKTEYEKVQRLIKIAMPIQLPSIKIQTDENSGDKKKSVLPLFGKRNKLKVNIPRPASSTPNKIIEKDLKSDEEEIEDDEPIEKDIIPKDDDKLENIPTELLETKLEIESKKEDEPNTKDESPKPKIIGPAFIPPEIAQMHDIEIISDENKTDDITIEKNDDDTENNDGNSSIKKRRNRNRYRTKGRENVDIDDTEESKDIEKYSGWVPPDNQKGDGITSLNQKFGY